MSIWDGDNNPLNIPLPTFGESPLWENLESRNGYRLQKNMFTGHCRVIDENDIRRAWGLEGPMRAEFRKLTCKSASLRARYGDVIGVHRQNGLYDHYGVYENSGCVYEYAARDGDFGDVKIRATTLKKFLAGSSRYFVLTFPKHYGVPGKVNVELSRSPRGASLVPDEERIREPVLEVDATAKEYHLYSPEQTILRARSRLGERKYHLASNNCEHFAIWCKTGISQSHQVDALLNSARVIDLIVQSVESREHPKHGV